VSLSEHIAQDRVLFVLALAEDDPERVAAFEHAEHCAQCQAAIAHSRELLELIDGERDSLLTEPISAAFEARVRTAVFEPKQSRWAVYGLWLGAALSAFLVWIDAHPGSPELSVARGMRCMMHEGLFALGAFVLGAVAAKWYTQRASPAQSALVAMTGALAGQAHLLVRCESQGAVWHLLLSHLLGVAVATAAGALVGPRLVLLGRAAR
jgi:hypothetical protein